MANEERENIVEIGRITAGRSREFRVLMADYKGHTYAYIELYTLGEERPRGGVTMRPSLVPDLMRLLDAALAEAVRRNGGVL